MTAVARTKPGVLLSPTGVAAHYQDGALIVGIERLEIVEDGPGFFLFQFDGQDVVLIDTWHDTVEEALDRAALEYGIDRDAWAFH